MKILARFIRLFAHADDTVLDHVPVQSEPSKKRANALKRARERHGKQFHTHTRKARETEPSWQLRQIQDSTSALPADVPQIGKRKAAK